MAMLRGNLHYFILAASIIAIVGTVLSVTIRDQNSWLAVLYYATPWLLRLLAAVVAIAFWPRRKFVIFTSAICIAIATSQAFESYRNDSPAPTLGSSFKVSFSNSARKLNERPDLWPLQSTADISAFVETGDFTNEQFQAFQKTSPSHQWLRLDKGMMIGVRGQILSQESIGVKDRFNGYQVRVLLPAQGEFSVFVIDIRSIAWIPREPTLKKILDATANDPRCILLGDFNTPSQSRWLDDWRKNGLTLANDGSRKGFRETWAFGLPLLTLDQIWIGKHWQSLSAIQSRPGYDHDRMEIALEKSASDFP